MRLHTRSAAALPEDDEYHAQEQEERAARLADAVWVSEMIRSSVGFGGEREAFQYCEPRDL